MPSHNINLIGVISLFLETTAETHHFCRGHFWGVITHFFIDMCHRIASLLFLYLTILLVNLRYYLRYYTLCMLQFYFIHVCGLVFLLAKTMNLYRWNKG